MPEYSWAMSAAGSGAGEGVALDADAPSTNLDDGHRPALKQLDLSEQGKSLSDELKDLSVGDQDPNSEAGPSLPNPETAYAAGQPAEMSNGHTHRTSEDRDRQTSAGTTESYDTCNIGELQSNTSSSANALEDGDGRVASLSSQSSVADQSRLQDLQDTQSKATSPTQTVGCQAPSPYRIPNGQAQDPQDSPTTATNSLLPTPASEEITALRMSGPSSLSADPYRGSPSSQSEAETPLHDSQLLTRRPSTSQSTRVPSNLSHDPLHNGETLMDEGHTDYQPIPIVELALHQPLDPSQQQRQQPEILPVSRMNGVLTQAQNGHEPSYSPEDPFVTATSSSNWEEKGDLQRQSVSNRNAIRREQGDDYVESLATSSPTSHRGQLSQSTGQSLTGLPGSPTTSRSPRSSLQKTRGGDSIAASTGHHNSSSSIGNDKPSADSTAPLGTGPSMPTRPSKDHGSAFSETRASQSTFAQQQTAPPFSQTVPPQESLNARPAEHSRSSSSRDRDKERSTSHVSGKERERSSRRQLGEWTLGKTLGAGSMGKVKLGVSTVTGEKVCTNYAIQLHALI